MAYYRTCPLCRSNLDPGEVCDCQKEKEGTAPLHRETAPGEKTPKAIIAFGAPGIKAVTL